MGEKLTRADYLLLNSIELHCMSGRDTWRPYRGKYAWAERMAKQNILLECGISAMPPHKLYIVSDKGRRLLAKAAPSPSSKEESR